ncbi:creatininase family protein [Candidatus Leptofilum sp.]|uniref:creatininase family protein n=1 Tax=Candidatus Leptofilum sp. TaxID=3241576 RepID=UPI003B5A3015
MKEVRWERMFPDQLEAAFQNCPLLYFTYGLCEPHGPQNALGLDALKAHGIACEAARTFGGIVAPPDYWHIHELGGYATWGAKYVGEVQRKWLTAVPPWIHFKNICYHIRTADTLGFHAAIFLTGHYGPNWQDLKTLIQLIQPYTKTRLYGLPDFEANQPGFAGEGQNDGFQSGDHAGKIETSLLWAVEPACVDLSRLPQAVRQNVPDKPHYQESAKPGERPLREGTAVPNTPPYFAMGADAPHANRTIGERMVQDEVDWLTAKAQTLLDEYDATAAAPGLSTFESVEQFWDKEIRPRLPEFKSMSLDFGLIETVDEQSVWYANWHVPERS